MALGTSWIRPWSAQHPLVCPQYLGDDAAELRAVLGEGQQVADGAADRVNAVR